LLRGVTPAAATTPDGGVTSLSLIEAHRGRERGNFPFPGGGGDISLL